MKIMFRRKLTSLFLALVLALSLLPLSVAAAGNDFDEIPQQVETTDRENGTAPQSLDETPVPAECQLDQLYFTNTWLSPKPNDIYVMEPAFEPTHRNYTMYVPDSEYLVYAYAAFSPESYIEDTTIQARYLNASGEETTKDLKAKSLFSSNTGVFAYGTEQNLTGKVMTIWVGGQEAYRIQIVRVAAGSAQFDGFKEDGSSESISTINSKESLVGKNTYQRSIYWNHAPDADTWKLIIKPYVYPSDSIVKINGEEIEHDAGCFEHTVMLLAEEVTDELGQTFRHAQVIMETIGNHVESMEGIPAQDSKYTFDIYSDEIASLKVATPPTKTEYTMGDSFNPAGMAITAVYASGAEKDVPLELCDIQPTDGLLPADTSVTVSYQGRTVTQPITVEMETGLNGAGTQDDPYRLANAEDLKKISDYVSFGYSFEGEYLQLTDSITLPQDWTPIGTLNGTSASSGVNILPFSGTLDGNNKTITFASGSKPLFNYVREAAVHDLTIYAPYMDGYALVDCYTVDYGADGNYNSGSGGSYVSGCPDTIDITNVTIKSGSIIKSGGYIGGTASGGNVVNITNCTVEAGVKIGCTASGTPAENLGVGSFASGFNGTITNCVSYADVYGTNSAGGIVGYKGQSMGPYTITNCAFYGNVHASGSRVGGIAGSGYVNSTAPNTPCAVIKNCIFAGTIEGQDDVGGILGAEGHLQAWDNGIGNISNNLSMGTIIASGTKGGIVGNISSLNCHNILDNNYYLETQATKGIGTAAYVDTNAAEHETTSGATYFNSANALPGVKGISKTGHNREDDPLGADAENLAKAFAAEALTDGSLVEALNMGTYSSNNWEQGTNAPQLSGQPVLSELKLSGSYKTEYYTGETLDMTGAVFTAVWSDGTEESVSSEHITFTGYNPNTQGVQTVTASYGSVSATFTVTVRTQPSTNPGVSNTITVYFTLLGDVIHDQDENGNGIPTANGGPHTQSGGNLETWIPRKAYTVDRNTTVWELMQPILAANGIEADTNTSSGTVYVAGLRRAGGEWLSEFTNGSNSGWMYTLNGEHPSLGIAQQFLTQNNSEVVFHYTDDYTQEKNSENWSSPGSSGSNTTTPGTTTPGATAPGTEEPGTGDSEPTVSVTEVEDGTATTTVDGEALAESLKDTDTNTPVTITADIPEGETVTKTEVVLTRGGVGAIADAEASLKAETPLASIVLSNQALQDVAGTASQKDEEVTITASVTENGIRIEVAVAGKALEEINGGLSVTLPVAETEWTAGSVMALVDAEGNETVIKKSALDEMGVTALLDGSCTVTVVNNARSFSDTTQHWASDAINFVSARELFQGTDVGIFEPDETMTRAMLVTVLHRLEDTPDADVTEAFGDVPAGTWYTDSVFWASENSIVNGVGGGSFAPDDSITREQMATMMYRYANVLGLDTSVRGDTSKFIDAGAVSDWASAAMEWAAGAGLIEGKGNGVLDPGGSATRAEVAAVLQRLVQWMVS